MIHLSEQEFEDAIRDALDAIPDEFIDEMNNVAVMAELEPSPDDLAQLDENGEPAGIRQGGEILGVFIGEPLTERPFDSFEGETPDVIKIFKGPHERSFPDYDQLINQIRKTVIHEVGHYFGWDDAHMHALGY